MHWRSFISGCIAGGIAVTAASFAFKTYGTLDRAVTQTDQRATVDTLHRESDVLRRMAEPHWIGLRAIEAKERLVSLELFDFEKGEDGFAAGPVYLKLTDGIVSEIHAHCARRMPLEKCREEEEG